MGDMGGSSRAGGGSPLSGLLRILIAVCAVLLEAGNSVEEQPYLLFSTRQSIYKVNLNSTPATAPPLLTTPRPSGVDRLAYHYRLDSLFWIGGSRSQFIMTSSLNGSNVRRLIRENLGDPADLAVDWINNRLYWVDSSRREINDYNLITGQRRQVLSTGEAGSSNPAAIALYPYPNYGWVYWSDRGNLKKASVTGDDRSTLRSDLNCVNVISIDYSSVTIYWINHCQYAIHSLRLDGDAATHTFPFTDHSIIFPSGLVIKNNTFFWSEPGSIYQRSNADNAAVQTVYSLPLGSRATGMQIVDKAIQPQAEEFISIIAPSNATTTFQCTAGCVNGICIPPGLCACNDGWRGAACNVDQDECSEFNGGCDHLCSNMIGYYFCSCREAFTLNDDLHTCTDVNECDQMNGGCEQECLNTIGSYYCTCGEGYRLANNSHTCEDIDECLTEGQCQQTCTNLPGSFSCGCHSGYSLDSAGINCININIHTTSEVMPVFTSQQSMDAMHTIEVIHRDSTQSTSFTKTSRKMLSTSIPDLVLPASTRTPSTATLAVSTPGSPDMMTNSAVLLPLGPSTSPSQPTPTSTVFSIGLVDRSTIKTLSIPTSISRALNPQSTTFSMEPMELTTTSSMSPKVSQPVYNPITSSNNPVVTTADVTHSLLLPDNRMASSRTTAVSDSSPGTSRTDETRTTSRQPTPAVQTSSSRSSSPTSSSRRTGSSSPPQPTFTPNIDVDVASNRKNQSRETTIIAVTVTLVVVCLLIAIIALLIAIVAVRRKHRSASYTPEHREQQTSMTLNVSVKKISSTFAYTSKP